jgi:hypothetical protein
MVIVVKLAAVVRISQALAPAIELGTTMSAQQTRLLWEEPRSKRQAAAPSASAAHRRVPKHCCMQSRRRTFLRYPATGLSAQIYEHIWCWSISLHRTGSACRSCRDILVENTVLTRGEGCKLNSGPSAKRDAQQPTRPQADHKQVTCSWVAVDTSEAVE